MSNYDELKRMAEAANAVTGDASVDIEISSERGPNQPEIDVVTAFVGAATPAAVLALIAENERLEREAKNDLIAYKAAIERQNELRAEIAGLRTGYQAYERVNAELEAEVEGLRKDADRYRWVKKESNLSDYEDCYSLPMVHAWDYKPGPELNEQFESLDAAIDSAIGNGEQS